jgi:glycosyltransferase involved in cell wall biosynthesis
MEPTVSVVVTTYNQARYIEQTLQSVFDQTAPAFEVIVVDDGSTDNTPSLLAPFRGRIKYIRQHNQGVASSRNTGIAQARGEYVALLDGDDLWEPRKLAAQIEAAYRFPKSGIIVANGVEFDESGIIQPSLLCDVQRVLRLPEDQVVTVPYCDQALEWNPIWTVSQVMIPRAVLQHIGVSDSTFTCGSDYDLYLRIAEKYDLTFIMERLVRWRYLTTSASGRREIRALRYRLDHILALKKQTRTTSEPRRALIKNILDRRVPLASESAYYYGRQHDRLLATRMLWRLFTSTFAVTSFVYLLALWIPSSIIHGTAPTIRRILGLPRG